MSKACLRTDTRACRFQRGPLSDVLLMIVLWVTLRNDEFSSPAARRWLLQHLPRAQADNCHRGKSHGNTALRSLSIRGIPCTPLARHGKLNAQSAEHPLLIRMSCAGQATTHSYRNPRSSRTDVARSA